jgi:hypothetical protein
MVDPATLSLDDLRDLRSRLQSEDDVVSYVRRVAQARLDLVRAEQHLRERGETHDDLPTELRVVLSQHLTGGPPRPPRSAVDLDDAPLADELDRLCAHYGFSRLGELPMGELNELEARLTEFEHAVSGDRRARYEQLDALSAELVRRYRDGEASVDGLLE